MNVRQTELPGVLIIEPKVFADARGFFMESYHARRYHEVGLSESFVQDNLSYSRRGTLRGLHYQSPRAQGKLVYVLQGEVFDVAVDIRAGSATFGQWLGTTLVVRAAGVRSRLLRYKRDGAGSVQVHRVLRPVGRGEHSLERPNNRHRLAAERPGAFRKRSPCAAAFGRGVKGSGAGFRGQ
jgi:hypothetical protein